MTSTISPYIRTAQAVRSGRIGDIEDILTRDASIAHTTGDHARTLLFHAPTGAVAQLLVKLGVPIDARDAYGFTALHFAASNALSDTCIWLANNGLHVNDTDGQGCTSLHHAAASYDGVDTVKALVKLGASVTALSHLPLGIGQQPLHAAAMRDREEIVSGMHRSYLLSVGAPVNGLSSAGRTAMHMACEQGHIGIVRLLLAANGNVNIADKSGWTPLHLACLGSWPQHESHTAVAELLVSHGSIIDARTKTGLTALHCCTDSPAARVLMDHKADLDALDNDMRTPLHYCSAENAVELLKRGANVAARDRYGRQALHLTTNTDKVRVLVARGSPINSNGNDGKTPLDWAIESNRPDVTLLIRQLGGRRGTPVMIPMQQLMIRQQSDDNATPSCIIL